MSMIIPQPMALIKALTGPCASLLATADAARSALSPPSSATIRPRTAQATMLKNHICTRAGMSFIQPARPV